MDEPHLNGLLDFLRQAERLKATMRSGYTTAARPESVAEHTWRLCLMAFLLAPEFPGVDFARLVKICLIHDLGEAIGGDVPAPEQARLLAEGNSAGKSADERRDLLTLVAPLSRAQRDEIVALWDEYESAHTAEARLAKALDKLETILQHTQGRNPPGFDYRFNLGYARPQTASPPLIAAIRRVLDQDTEARAVAADRAREAAVQVGPRPMPAFLSSEATLDAFLEGFRAGTFPIKQWTHGAHVAMASAILWEQPVPVALRTIRSGIRSYNVRQGGENTATSGYHETLTRLWTGLVAAHLASLPDTCSRLEAVRETYRAFAGQAAFFRDWYSFDLVTSAEARAEWVAPDSRWDAWTQAGRRV